MFHRVRTGTVRYLVISTVLQIYFEESIGIYATFDPVWREREQWSGGRDLLRWEPAAPAARLRLHLWTGRRAASSSCSYSSSGLSSQHFLKFNPFFIFVGFRYNTLKTRS
jgi:hypothetical protein